MTAKCEFCQRPCAAGATVCPDCSRHAPPESGIGGSIADRFRRVHAPGSLIETFKIDIPGRRLVGCKYASWHLHTNRRIVVREQSGPVDAPASLIVFDTGDIAAERAGQALSHWVMSQDRTTPPTCDVCAAPVGDGQATADTVLCGECCRRIKAGELVTLAGYQRSQDAVNSPDPILTAADDGNPHAADDEFSAGIL